MTRTARILISSVCLFFVLPVFSQDSVLYQWQVTSKKVGDKKYEIIFRTSGAKGWQLYAPDQVFEDFKTTEIIFPDSSIHKVSNFSASGEAKNIHSTIFQHDVKV